MKNFIQFLEAAIKLGTQNNAKANQYIDTLFSLHPSNPLNDNELVIEGGGVVLRAFEGDVWIQSLRAIEQGGGRQAIGVLIKLADEIGVNLCVDPVPFESIAGKTMTEEGLIEWYGEFGFEQQDDYLKRYPKNN